MENIFLTDAELPATVADIKSLQSKIADIPAGPAGQSGATIQNYGGSLVKNSALDLGTLEGWTGATFGDGINFLSQSVKTTDLATNGNCFKPVLNYLYAVEYFVKSEGTNLTEGGGVFMDAYTENNVLIGTNELKIYPFGGNWADSVSSNFVFKKLYFGGYGTNTYNVKDGTSKISTTVFKAQGVSITVNALIVRKVDLGEHVPFNLPYLPQWQAVYDPTTGETGLFNGNTVVWNATA